MSLSEGTHSQVCYVVNDIEASATAWSRATGAGPWYLAEPAYEDKIYRGQGGKDRHLLALGFMGATSIELYQPLDDEPSIVREILDSRGEGFHHVWPMISGLAGAAWEAKCREYEQRGLKAAMTCTLTGLGRAAFYDALDEIGGFIEVLEIGEGIAMIDALHQIHLGWDGTDPIRALQDLVPQG